jgi:hypothetical protein
VIPTLEPGVIPTLEPGVIPTLEPEVIPTLEPEVIPTLEPGVIPGWNRETHLVQAWGHTEPLWVTRRGTRPAGFCL